jgi:hypothetical protein
VNLDPSGVTEVRPASDTAVSSTTWASVKLRMIRHPPGGQVVVLAFEKPRRPISDLVHHGASIDRVIRLDDEAEFRRQPSARRRVRPFVRARMATARAAPQGGCMAFADGPPLDEQPIGPVQEEHRDRAVKAARSQVRVELAERADRAPRSVDKFDARTTIVGIAHPTLPSWPRVPFDEGSPNDDRVEREQQEQQRELRRGVAIVRRWAGAQ